jgi:hypothetical protein
MVLNRLLTITNPTRIVYLSSDQVFELQSALQQLGYDITSIDGIVGPNTTAAWTAFKQDTGEDEPDLIGPGSVTALQQRLQTGILPSGVAWTKRFPGSSSTDDLRPPFKASAVAFVSALRAANVNVIITATWRPAQRAYLMHYAQQIAIGAISASDVPRHPDVPIQWVHSTNAASVTAAQAMVDSYGIIGPVALNSRHIEGHAIDMFLDWSATPSVIDAAGTPHMLRGRPGAYNTDVIEVGKTFGVIRGIAIAGDPEHWSIDGS